MKGIYLTEQSKQEIEAKIAELKHERDFQDDEWDRACNTGEVFQLEEILKSATVLSVGESWEKYVHPALVPFFEKDLKNGVIIQPKQQ